MHLAPYTIHLGGGGGGGGGGDEDYDGRADRSGQVRSECLTCTFIARCCSVRLSGQEKKGGRSKGGPTALAGTMEYKQSDRNR